MSSALMTKLRDLTYIPSDVTFAHGDRFATITKYQTLRNYIPEFIKTTTTAHI
jgi:hypothetical protein